MPYANIKENGLHVHLDDTKDKHNGHGWDDFDRYMTHGDEFGERISDRKLARIFNTTRPTIERWKMLYPDTKKKIMNS